LLSWSADPSLVLPALDLGPNEQEVTVDVGISFTPGLEGLSSLLAPPVTAELAGTCQELESTGADRAVRPKDIEVLQADLVTASIRAAELRQSLADLDGALHGRPEEMARLATDNRAYVESLLSQNDEIRRLEAANQVVGMALLELRDRLTAAQRWLGELRNRALVRLSLAIHREKWPL